MDASLIQDFAIVIQLVILEGLLSLDNALALAALVEKRLASAEDRRKALTWGIWGAYLFRIIAIFIGTWLMQNHWVKVIAGAYLLWLAFDELWLKRNAHQTTHKELIKEPRLTFLKLSPLWGTVLAVELMDIMFSIDSIGVALVLSKKKWVLILGAVLGIIMMRIAAQMFIGLIKKFPILTKTAFILVGIAGLNIVLETKDLPIPFTTGALLTIDKAIPEVPFLIILFSIFIGSMVLNSLFPKAFSKHSD